MLFKYGLKNGNCLSWINLVGHELVKQLDPAQDYCSS